MIKWFSLMIGHQSFHPYMVCISDISIFWKQSQFHIHLAFRTPLTVFHLWLYRLTLVLNVSSHELQGKGLSSKCLLLWFWRLHLTAKDFSPGHMLFASVRPFVENQWPFCCETFPTILARKFVNWISVIKNLGHIVWVLYNMTTDLVLLQIWFEFERLFTLVAWKWPDFRMYENCMAFKVRRSAEWFFAFVTRVWPLSRMNSSFVNFYVKSLDERFSTFITVEELLWCGSWSLLVNYLFAFSRNSLCILLPFKTVTVFILAFKTLF